MRNLLFATTILSGLTLALPSVAQDVGIGADAGVSGGVGASAGVGGTGVGAGADAGVSGGVGASAGVGGVGVGAGADAGVSGGVGASAGVGGTGVGIGADADAGASAGLNADGNVGATVGATLGGTVAGPAAVSGQALASVDASLIIGAPIVSADGAIIGTVADITTDTTGKVMVTVDLAGELGLSIGSVRIGAEHAAFVDGQVRLNMTEASLVAALEAQSAASVEADADVGATLGAQAAIGRLAGMRAGDLRATLSGLGSDDVRTLKLSCAEVLANPAAYSADTRTVCEVIASL